MSKEKQCECCNEWWYGSDVKENLCPNCYDYFKQLKRQLEEKDEQINNLEQMCQICNKDQENEKLKQQLEEKDKEIEKLKTKQKPIVMYSKEDYFKRCNFLEEENIKLQFAQKQLAIQELEKVKELLITESKRYPIVYDITNDLVGGAIDKNKVFETLDNQIKKLKGE